VLCNKRLYHCYGLSAGLSKADELNQAFAKHMCTQHALVVSSGSAELIRALIALSVDPPTKSSCRRTPRLR